MQVVENPIVQIGGQKRNAMLYEADVLSRMNGKPNVVQYYGYCLGPPDANPQQGFLLTE